MYAFPLLVTSTWMPRGGPAGLSGCTARRVGACRRTCSSSAAVASCAASCASSASTRSCDDASAASSCSSGVRLPCRAAWRARSALCAWPEEGARSQATQTGKNANRVRVRIMRPAAHNLGACLPHRSTRRWCKCSSCATPAALGTLRTSQPRSARPGRRLRARPETRRPRCHSLWHGGGAARGACSLRHRARCNFGGLASAPFGIILDQWKVCQCQSSAMAPLHVPSGNSAVLSPAS